MRQRSYLQRKAAPVAPNPMESLKAILQYAAVLLTILVAFFYYFGYLYHSNLIAYWGLTTDMFSLTKEETIIVGAVQLTTVTMKLIADNIILLVSIGFLVLAGVIISCIRGRHGVRLAFFEFHDKLSGELWEKTPTHLSKRRPKAAFVVSGLEVSRQVHLRTFPIAISRPPSSSGHWSPMLTSTPSVLSF